MALIIEELDGDFPDLPGPETGGYVTLGQARAYHGALAALDDTALTGVLVEASGLVEGFTHRRFVPGLPETVSLPTLAGRAWLPGRAEQIDRVWTDRGGDLLPGAWTVESFPDGDVLRLGYLHRGKVQVQGRFGWPVPPPPVVRATLVLAAALTTGTGLERRDPALISASVEGYSRSWQPGADTATTGSPVADGLLRPLRREPVQLG